MCDITSYDKNVCECVHNMTSVSLMFADGVHCLTCALMLLNTDLHGPVSDL